jgi:hypothetical protein
MPCTLLLLVAAAAQMAAAQILRAVGRVVGYLR